MSEITRYEAVKVGKRAWPESPEPDENGAYVFFSDHTTALEAQRVETRDLAMAALQFLDGLNVNEFLARKRLRDLALASLEDQQVDDQPGGDGDLVEGLKAARDLCKQQTADAHAEWGRKMLAARAHFSNEADRLKKLGDEADDWGDAHESMLQSDTYRAAAEYIEGFIPSLIQGGDADDRRGGNPPPQRQHVTRGASEGSGAPLQASVNDPCPRCDNTHWLCAECKEPRGRCWCGVNGASEDGCPECIDHPDHPVNQPPHPLTVPSKDRG